jgi:hypothetical protein
VARLEQYVERFLVGSLGAECINELVKTPEQEKADKADYFLEGRRVVLELKDLQTDQGWRVQKVLDRWRRAPDWPLFGGQLDLSVALQRYPRRETFERELYYEVCASLDRVVKKANRQLRETRRTFTLDNSALGVLAILNDRFDLLTPSVVATRLGQLIARASRDGRRRFGDLDSAIYVQWAHEVERSDGARRTPVIAVVEQRRVEAGYPGRFEDSFMEAWARFLHLPFENGGVISTVDGLEALRLRRRYPSSVFEAGLLEPRGA